MADRPRELNKLPNKKRRKERCVSRIKLSGIKRMRSETAEPKFKGERREREKGAIFCQFRAMEICKGNVRLFL